MLQGLKERVDAALLEKVNIICSRVRHLDPVKPNILWLHDLWNDPEAAHLANPAERAKFAQLVFVSHYQMHTYNLGLGVPLGAGVVLQNAIEPIPLHQKPASPIRLIYHTTPHRGLEILVPCFEVLAKEYGSAVHLDVYSSFSIYGWPERDKQYHELFELCRRHPHITYHGFQPNHVIRAALQQAHIFAYPSIWPETSCIAAIEAMSAECEVVCPNYAALPETTANFAALYQFDEDINIHANRFVNVLGGVIHTYLTDFSSVKERLKIQKAYMDSVYNWTGRARQWTYLLESIVNRHYAQSKNT